MLRTSYQKMFIAGSNFSFTCNDQVGEPKLKYWNSEKFLPLLKIQQSEQQENNGSDS